MSSKIEIHLDQDEVRKSVTYFDDKKNLLKLPLFIQNEGISGKVKLNFGMKCLKHFRVMIYLIGEIESYYATEHPDVFLSRSRELKQAGMPLKDSNFSFSFQRVEKPYETYYGNSGRIRYYLKATLVKGIDAPLYSTSEFAVQLPINRILNNQGYRGQLRIDDYLMVNAEINKTCFAVDDCIIGKLFVSELKLRIKTVQVSLMKREIFNPSSTRAITQEELITKQEITRKCPKKGDIIPFKLNLSVLDLSPSCDSKLYIKYILTLSFVDDESRSLFKPLEVDIFRRE